MSISVRYAIATAGTPATSSPSTARPATIRPNVGANGIASPTAVAPSIAKVIARTRPTRSATQAQGSTPTARPNVAAETSSDVAEADVASSRAASGRTDCGA
jgi:hypothetical protein